MSGDNLLWPNPYVGPREFRQDEQEFFFGRNEEIAILEGLVIARPTVLLYSQSGAGKSSLLRAGLIPTLMFKHKVGRGQHARIFQKMKVLAVTSVGGTIPDDVIPAEVSNVFVFSLLLSLLTTHNRYELARMTLSDGLRLLLEQGADDIHAGSDALLIIDQFEQLFTRHLDRWQEREEFFKQVTASTQSHHGLRVLLSIREDYIAALTPYAGLLPDHLKSRFRLEPLRPSAALDAVRRPARRAGREFQESAANELIERLCRSQTAQTTTQQSPSPSAGSVDEAGLYVDPVHLQVVCRQLWEKLPTDQKVIGLEDVVKLGDVDAALTAFYEASLREAATTMGDRKPLTHDDDRELVVRYWFEKQLITGARTRNLVHSDAAATGSLPNDAVYVLDQAHIVQPMRRGNDTWYELAHDRLIAPILRANQTWWLQQSRLVRAAKAWDDANRHSLPPIDTALEQEILQADESRVAPFIHDFIVTLRAEVDDKFQQDRLLKRNLAEIGWGIIFANNTDPALRAALVELLTHRQAQAQTRFAIFEGEKGYKNNTEESVSTFVERQETSSAPAGPVILPYYLTIVGPPTSIPFEFQYQLGINNHAVGRIAFDTLPEYARYARSVVTAETRPVILPRRAAFFATRHPDDPATNLTFAHLATPLLQELRGQYTTWEIELMAENLAQKEALQHLLAFEPPLSLLFTATHGMTFAPGNKQQSEATGALLCQNWGGPIQAAQTISPDFYFAASDLANLAQPRLLGMIAFLFGEFTAGSPHVDNFTTYRRAFNNEPQIKQLAPEPFVARLPQQMLSHPAGGALAVIGHVDVNWSTSFASSGGRGHSRIGAFTFLCSRLMAGYPVGAALEEFRNRYQRELARWAELQIQVNQGQLKAHNEQLAHASQETAMIDLRNYIVLGDPAVRLLVAAPDQPPPIDRPVLAPVRGLAELKFHPGPVTAVAWRTDGAQLLSVCADGLVRIWPAAAGEPWTLAHHVDDPLQVASWRADGRQIATLSRKGILLTWDVSNLTDHAIPAPVRVHEQADLALWQPNGFLLAVISGSHFHLWDSSSDVLVRTFSGHTNRLIRFCAWHPDGRQLATTGRDATLRIWETTTGREIQRIDGNSTQESLGQVRWSPDGKFLAYTAESRMPPQALSGDAQPASLQVIRILDATTFAPLYALCGHNEPIRVLDWHPASNLLASVSSDRAVVWDIAQDMQRFAVEHSTIAITNVAYSLDGQLLLSTSEDQIIRFWNTESGEELYRSSGHSGKVTDCVWSPDNKSVTIARSDNVVLLVSIQSLAQ